MEANFYVFSQTFCSRAVWFDFFIYISIGENKNIYLLKDFVEWKNISTLFYLTFSRVL